jgi:hypothetical protein
MTHKKIAVWGVALLFLLPCEAPAQQAGRQTGFSRSECVWAADWINRELSLLMGRGVITKIVLTDNGWTVYAGAPWRQLAFDQQGRILQEMSRAREITGHSAFVTIVDEGGQEKLAEVSLSGIQILVPGEGFVQYADQQTADQERPDEAR